MVSTDEPPQDLDVIIIGAGISGLNTAYRVQTTLPDYSYAILEATGSIGGTWSLFRYPGVRSDTDLHNFGFGWRPWTEKRLLADGPAILKYLQRSIEAEEIDQHIRFHHKVVSANWSVAEQVWKLSVEVMSEIMELRGRALVVGSGYYDHHTPLAVDIPGLQDFAGQVIHPQFWPEELDYQGKRVVIIGSGATAVTLLPNMTESAAHVTMVQRSPTYIMPLPNASTSWMDSLLPASLVFMLIRFQLAIMPILIYAYSRWFPRATRKMLRTEAVKYLGDDYPVDEHFKPAYEPWDQRLCFAPDGDFYKAIRAGTASVVTGRIGTVGRDSITMQSGKKMHADIIITATGLKLAIGGGIAFSVDGQSMNLAEKVLWRHSWLQDVPNCAFVLGYTNASWTLGADTTAILFCRMLEAMRSRNFTSVVPRVTNQRMQTRPYFDIKSTYAKQGAGSVPVTGDTGPWKGRTNSFLDWLKAAYGGIEEGLDFYKGPHLLKRAA
jgi:cation diffusion facilitator CzcD-associated flavoprotein CzcO